MENKQQPVVNICGSCILRDTFYYQGVYGKEKDGGYRINRYVNFFSPLALEQPPIPIYDRIYQQKIRWVIQILHKAAFAVQPPTAAKEICQSEWL